MNDMCPNCGQSIAADAPTCIYCGTALGPTMAAATVQSAPQPAPVQAPPTDNSFPPLPDIPATLPDVPAAVPNPQQLSHAATMQAPIAAVPGASPLASIPGLQLGSSADHDLLDTDAALPSMGPALELDAPDRITRGSMAQAEVGATDVEQGLAGEDPAKPKQKAKRNKSPQQIRGARVVSIADYGPAPRSVLQAPLYFLKVFQRKRVLAGELLQLTKVRKRASEAHTEALCQVGEALHVRRNDASLAPLAQQFAAISVADTAIDRQQEDGAASRDDALREVEVLANKIAASDAQLRPMQQRRDQLEKQTATLTQKMAEAEAEAARIDSDTYRISNSEPPVPQHQSQLAELVTQRESVSEVMQRIDGQLGPFTQEMGQLEGKIRKCERITADLVTERDSLSEIMGRERDRQDVEAGAMRGDLREGLKALAEAAIAKELTAMVTSLTAQVEKLTAELKRKGDHEGLYRAALNSFDQAAFKQGGMIIVGGTGVAMLSLLILIFS